MRFREFLRDSGFALLALAVALCLASCATDSAAPGAGEEVRRAPYVGTLLGDSLRFHQAFHRSNTQTFPSTVTRDDDGIFLASALRVVDVQDQAKRLAPDLLGQVLCLPRDASDAGSDVMLYADGFQEIEQIFWHDRRLHVIHGYDYTTVIGTPGQPAKAQREERSKVPAAADRTSKRKVFDVDVFNSILANRKEPNEHRIQAIWRLRDMTNEWSVRPTRGGMKYEAEMTPAEFDPVKAFIWAMHNGPDPLRAAAARALRMRSVDTSPAIKGLIHRAKNDSNATVRMEAALTLGHLKAKDAAVELMGSLDDPDDTARIAKMLAIRMIAEWELAPAFVNAASERTRGGMLLALQDVQNSQAIAAMKFAAISSPYPAIRLKAITILERTAYPKRLRDESFFSAMNEAVGSSTHPELRDLKWPIRWVVRSKSEHFDDIIATIREATRDEDAAVRTAAAQSLGRILSQQ